MDNSGTHLITIIPGHVLTGTNPATDRPKRATGTGTVVRTETGGFHGITTVVRWTNGVETYHCAALETGSVCGL